MARKSKRRSTVSLPKTFKMTKKMGRRTVKKVRFFVKKAKNGLMSIPSYLSRSYRKYSTRRRR